MLEASEILNARILIVDDQETNVLLLEQMLRNIGYTALTSTMDPRAVHALHEQHRYDLILLDLQMPDMDGFEVMESLKDLETDGYLPVLVITAQPAHKLRALQAGAKDFVGKPFDFVEVQTRIHNMLEVRLLYRKLDMYNKVLEQTVLERTAELRESRARFKSFTELSSDWYWEQDQDGKFTMVSGPVYEMLGIDTDDGPDAATPTGTMLTGRWNAAERARLDANIANRRPFLDYVYSRSNADGSTQYLQVSGEPIFDGASRFTGYRGIGLDVTARKRSQHEEVRFRAAIDTLAQGVCLFDRATMRIVDANLGACRLSGYSRDDMLALTPLTLGLDDDSAPDALFDGLIADGKSLHRPAVLRRKDGGTFAATLSWSALRYADKWVMVVVINSGAETAD